MSWFKLIRHDLRCGLMRWRYLTAMALFSIPCLLFAQFLKQVQIPGSWMDYMLYLFQGISPIDKTSDQVELPFLWLMMTGGCLFFNLDYFLKDLTQAGQQIIVRSKSRTAWYLSKCLWNFAACTLYFLLAGLCAGIFTLATGANLSVQNTPEVSFMIFGFAITEPLAMPPVQALTAAWVLPFLTAAALSMLQMTLCLYGKPVVGFVACVSILVLSIFWNTPFVLGTGAMVIRSGFASPGGISPAAAAAAAGVVTVASVIAGTLRFQRTDILNMEEKE